MQEHTDRVNAAIHATDHREWTKIVFSRAGQSESAKGSRYPDLEIPTLNVLIQMSEWEPYDHPDVADGCTAFSTPLPGVLGLVELMTLPVTTPVHLEDNKGSGKISAVVRGTPEVTVDFTVIILGPIEDEDGTSHEEVYTFHPGPPVRPSEIEATVLAGRTVTRDEAIALGFDFAKLA